MWNLIGSMPRVIYVRAAIKFNPCFRFFFSSMDSVNSHLNSLFESSSHLGLDPFMSESTASVLLEPLILCRYDATDLKVRPLSVPATFTMYASQGGGNRIPYGKQKPSVMAQRSVSCTNSRPSWYHLCKPSSAMVVDVRLSWINSLLRFSRIRTDDIACTYSPSPSLSSLSHITSR